MLCLRRFAQAQKASALMMQILEVFGRVGTSR